ncbi:type II secretion system protein GspG [Armatimonas rosea]|uniref:Type II secretory pathway pseudopilin PulG n=1 Tax=Armatimonas rosea TaxID=685828 RepID=A0A7W9SS11_ARMRO|nr:type II secretion system protein GspG [Armatimonas rosea]MBB6051757.1 type II secretory pathway pseudopilin PulG [Armatimonas rosea]
MNKVKKALALGCGTSLALLVGLGGTLWIRGNAAPEYTLPEWKVPTPNAYDTLTEAKKLEVSKLGKAAINPEAHYDKKAQKYIYPLGPLDDRKALLEKNQPAIAKLREALTQEFATPRKPGDIQALADNFPHFAEFRELARLLMFASRTYADLGQNDEASRCALDAITLGALVSHRSQLIGNLVGVACEAIGRKVLWERVDALDAKTARAAVARLEALEPTRYSFENVLLNERDFNQANTYVNFKNSNAWQYTSSYFSQIDEAQTVTGAMMGEEPEKPSALDRAKLLGTQVWMTGQFVWQTKKVIFAESGRYMTELAAQSKLPYDPKRPGPRMPTDPINQLILPVFQQAGQKDTATRAETALARVYLALRAYRLEKGEYPSTLAELVSADYLKALPDDPYAMRFGQPFGYRREAGDTFTLWSCGPDGDDDNGRAIKKGDGTVSRYVQTNDEGDLVARVNTY